MSTISALKQQAVKQINNVQLEYKESINNYLAKHNLNGNVIRLSDNQIGQIRFHSNPCYMLGKLGFFPLKKNGQVSRKMNKLVDENKILEQYKPFLESEETSEKLGTL